MPKSTLAKNVFVPYTKDLKKLKIASHFFLISMNRTQIMSLTSTLMIIFLCDATGKVGIEKNSGHKKLELSN